MGLQIQYDLFNTRLLKDGLAEWSKAPALMQIRLIGHAEVERSSPVGGAKKVDMKYLERTKFVTYGELEKHNTRTAWFKKLNTDNRDYMD